ncbi:MAG: DUF4412 domain-containing protein [Desulfobacterales bacterium]|nr:DUF4412 domain-containing protein [Desulfobacterales bacterium]
MKRMWYLPLLFAVFFIFSPAAYCDLYWESEVTSGGMPSNLPKQLQEQMKAQFKTKTEIVKNYLASDAFRSETPNNIMIMEFGNMIMYQINTKDKSYLKFDLMSVMGGKKGQMDKMMNEGMKITPTKETKEISGYKCKKYNVTIMGANTEYWISKDVKGLDEFKAMNKKMEKIAEKSPMLKKMNMAGMMNKLDGFPVQTVMSIMGMSTITTLKTIEKKSLDKELFKVPNGYKLKQMRMPPSKKK